MTRLPAVLADISSSAQPTPITFFAAVDSNYVSAQGLEFAAQEFRVEVLLCTCAHMRYLPCLLLFSDSLAHFCAQVRPAGAVNLGVRMKPPQEMVMYDLMAFIVWRGSYHLHSSQFATYASTASGSWVCFSARRREQGIFFIMLIRLPLAVHNFTFLPQSLSDLDLVETGHDCLVLQAHQALGGVYTMQDQIVLMTSLGL